MTGASDLLASTQPGSPKGPLNYSNQISPHKNDYKGAWIGQGYTPKVILFPKSPPLIPYLLKEKQTHLQPPCTGNPKLSPPSLPDTRAGCVLGLHLLCPEQNYPLSTTTQLP